MEILINEIETIEGVKGFIETKITDLKRLLKNYFNAQV
jgi:hypothetical protein